MVSVVQARPDISCATIATTYVSDCMQAVQRGYIPTRPESSHKISPRLPRYTLFSPFRFRAHMHNCFTHSTYPLAFIKSRTLQV